VTSRAKRTETDLDYHRRRAHEEARRAQRATSYCAKKAHAALSDLHFQCFQALCDDVSSKRVWTRDDKGGARSAPVQKIVAANMPASVIETG